MQNKERWGGSGRRRSVTKRGAGCPEEYAKPGSVASPSCNVPRHQASRPQRKGGIIIAPVRVMMNVMAAWRVIDGVENTRHARIATGSCRRQDAVAIWKSRAARRVAAASVVIALAWMLWPPASGEEPLEAGKRRGPALAFVSASTQHGIVNREPSLPPPADGLERESTSPSR